MRGGENLRLGTDYDMIANTNRVAQVKLVCLDTHMIAHREISIGLPSQTKWQHHSFAYRRPISACHTSYKGIPKIIPSSDEPALQIMPRRSARYSFLIRLVHDLNLFLVI